MAPAQDWCLECGTAAPGRLAGAGRAGFRAAATIISTVALLVGGAVAASYAALNSQAQRAATAPAPPSATPQVAQAPPAVTAPPPAPAPAPAPPAPSPKPAPAPAAPAPAPTPAPAPAPAPAPPTAAGNGGEASTADVHRPLDLGVDVADVYDPYDSALDQTDPSDSYDQNGKTVFTVTTDAAGAMAVGLTFDLEAPQQVEKVYFRTTTPGFTAEVYGARDELPPDILDNRWKLLKVAKDAGAEKGADGLEKVTFEPGRYRHIVLWFTTPPPAKATTDPAQPAPQTATVGISEVRILD